MSALLRESFIVLETKSGDASLNGYEVLVVVHRKAGCHRSASFRLAPPARRDLAAASDHLSPLPALPLRLRPAVYACRAVLVPAVLRRPLRRRVGPALPLPRLPAA